MSEKALDELLGAVYSTTVADAAVLVREVRVRVGVLPTRVTIRVFYDPRQREPYHFDLSAAMRPPGSQAAETADNTAPSESEALRRAVHTLSDAYEDAVRRGELPDEGWLVRGGVSR